MALTFVSQQQQQAEQQRQQIASKALQPILATKFGQVDIALARQQDLTKVAAYIVATAAQYLSQDGEAAAERVQHAFASMFSAASLPRLASLSPHNQEAELKLG